MLWSESPKQTFTMRTGWVWLELEHEDRHVTLGAGKYLVSARVNVKTIHVGPTYATCYVIAYQGGNWLAGTNLDDGAIGLNKSVGIDRGQIYLTETLTLSATAALQLRCSGGEATAELSWITAIKVGNTTMS